MINITDKHNCCGCEACVQACPKQCISFNEDTEGFRYPQVDESRCVECDACERACPVLSPYESRKPLQQLAAINPDSTIREASSSGGIFTMLAEQVINTGGVVYGVRFDENWQAIFDHTETIEGLAAFRGSKYIQARVGSTFIEVKEFLKSGRKVMFTGTPCQVAALRHFLHREYDHLLLVDFICHGVPSPKVWSRYLNEVTQNAMHSICDVQFRNKKQGWKRYNFNLTYDNGGQAYKISSWHQQNHYMRLFLNDVISRPSCHECKSKEGRSGSDLTIADFWGIDKLNPQMDDDKGTSLVLVNTNKGAATYSNLQLDSWEAQYEDIIKYNPGLRNASMHPKRSLFFAYLDDCESIISLIDDTLRLSFTQRLKRLIKRILHKVEGTFKKLKIKKPTTTS